MDYYYYRPPCLEQYTYNTALHRLRIKQIKLDTGFAFQEFITELGRQECMKKCCIKNTVYNQSMKTMCYGNSSDETSNLQS